jgi:hypothetical protein
MFEFAKLIHEALGIESTWAVVMVTALIFALVGGGAGWLVDSQYKHALVAQAPKADDKSTGRIRQLLVDGNEIVRVCQSVPNPYQTPASTRADLANQIVDSKTVRKLFYLWTMTLEYKKCGEARFFTPLPKKTHQSPSTARN